MNNNQKGHQKMQQIQICKTRRNTYKTLYFYCAMQSFWPEMYLR